jgi:hypothetical protein
MKACYKSSYHDSKADDDNINSLDKYICSARYVLSVHLM